MTIGGGHAIREEQWPNLRRLLLAFGFLAVAVGVVIAWSSPVNGYEVSIYDGTPWLFWTGIAIGFVTSIVVCAMQPRDRVARYGLGLAMYSLAAVVSLPIVRNYYFHGAADAMTHLGFAQDLGTGLIAPSELLYPGGHASALIVANGFGIPTERAMMISVFVLLVTFLVFVPILARSIVTHPSVTIIAGFSAVLLLPFNNVSTFYQFHAYSLGVMILPLLGYIIVKYLQSGAATRSWTSWFTGWNALLIWVGLSMLLVHPQVKLNILILLGAFSAVHAVSTWRYLEHPLAALRSTLVPFLTLSTIWFAWSFQHWQLTAALENLLAAVYYTALGEQQAGQAAADIGDSSGQIGSSLTELFLKMFLTPSVYALLAVVVVIVAMLATKRNQPRPDYTVITYVGWGGIVLAPFFFLYFLGDVSQYFFRHLGFAMVFATVLGALGIFYLAGGIAGSGGSPSLRSIGIGLCVIAIILTMPVIFASPYIYLPSGHISHGEVQGYDTAFSYADDETSWSGVRTGPGRMFDGLTPGDRPIEARGNSASDIDELQNMSTGNLEEPMYFPISERDYQREVIAFHEILFDDESIQAIHTEPQSNHIHSNGEFELYYFQPAD